MLYYVPTQIIKVTASLTLYIRVTDDIPHHSGKRELREGGVSFNMFKTYQYRHASLECFTERACVKLYL